jgi:hypothetical protein
MSADSQKWNITLPPLLLLGLQADNPVLPRLTVHPRYIDCFARSEPGPYDDDLLQYDVEVRLPTFGRGQFLAKQAVESVIRELRSFSSSLDRALRDGESVSTLKGIGNCVVAIFPSKSSRFVVKGLLSEMVHQWVDLSPEQTEKELLRQRLAVCASLSFSFLASGEAVHLFLRSLTALLSDADRRYSS